LEEKPAPGLEIDSSDPGIIIVSNVQAAAGPLSLFLARRSSGFAEPDT